MVPEKIDTIKRLKEPSNVTELKSFLGIINYYAKFIKNYSSIAAPLFNLLKKNVNYKWTSDHNAAFKRIKKLLASHEVLTHYDANLSLKVTCDAFPMGVGAVLAHVFPNEEERPITFASRVLTAAEKTIHNLIKRP